MRIMLLVALGGALGAVSRWGVGAAAQHLLGAAFPWGTLVVNVVGSFCIGLLAGAAGHLSDEVRMFAITGVLGAFTTFSAFSLDVLALHRTGAQSAAVGYVALSVALGVGAAALGLSLSRA